jgi:SAM-dependent methyltransferase
MKEEIALKILAKNKELYNNIASDFSRSRGTLWPDFEYFKGYIANGQDILDLGCGNGRLLELLEDYKVNYLGIDYSQKLISAAQSNWPKAKFLVADILNLPPLKEKFDLIFCVAVLHHIPSKKMRLQVLSEIKSLLKPDGKLLMTNWNLWQSRYMKYIIKYTLLKMTDPLNEANGIKHMNLDMGDVFIPWQKKYQRYVHAFTEMEVESLLKKSGFEVIKNVSNTRNIISVAKLK